MKRTTSMIILLLALSMLVTACGKGPSVDNISGNEYLNDDQYNNNNQSGDIGDLDGDGQPDGNGGTTSKNSGSSIKSSFGVKTTKDMPNYAKDLSDISELHFFVSAMPSEEEQNARNDILYAMTGKKFKFKYTMCKSWNTMSEELAVMVSANQAPDVFYIDITQGAFVVGKGIFEDISKYIDITDPLWKDTAKSPSDVYATKNNVRYAVVGNNNALAEGLLYNKNLTDAAVAKSGGTLQDPVTMFYNNKWTWDAFEKFAQLITVPGSPTPSVYGASVAFTSLVTWIAGTGTDIIKVDSKGVMSSNLSDANVLRCYQWIQSLSEKGYMDKLTWDNIENRFASGKIGFIGGHVWQYNTALYLPLKKAGTIQYVPYPKDPKAAKYYVNSSCSFSFIPKGAKNAKGAGLWYYLERYMYYNENQNYINTQKKMYSEDYGWTDADYQYYMKDVEKKVSMTNFIGNRLTGFDAGTFNEGVINPSIGTPASIINSIKSSHEAAVEKFNRGN